MFGSEAMEEFLEMKVLTINKNRIKLFAFCIGVFCLFLYGSMDVNATELSDGPVRLNNFTGEVMKESMADSTTIRIHSDCSYDLSDDQYLFKIDNKQVKSSVADGMITNYSVSIETESSTEFSLYKDGEIAEITDLSKINELGDYVLLYGGKKVLEFKIVGEYSNLEFFYVPKGFYIKEVLIDGEPAEYEFDVVSMIAEGLYEVTYVCEATNRVYSFQTCVDRTAPVLTLEELDKKGRSKGPVDLSDRENGSYVKVILDGKEIEEQDVLKQSGKYTVTIYDQAGNSTAYNFTIMLYFNMSSTVFMLLLLAVVIGVVAYIVVSAKLLRVY